MNRVDKVESIDAASPSVNARFRRVRMFVSRFNVAYLALLLAFSQSSHAFDDAKPSVTPNFRDTDVWQIVETVALFLGKRRAIADQSISARINLSCKPPLSLLAYRDSMQVVLAAYNLKLTDVSGAVGLTRTKIENPTRAVETSRDTGIPLSDLDAYITSTKDKDLATLSAPLRQYLSAGGQITELKAYSLLVIVDQKANVARIKEALSEYD